MTRWDIIASPFVETSPVTFPQLSPTIRLILNVHEKKEVHVLEFATTCCKSEYIRDGSVGSMPRTNEEAWARHGQLRQPLPGT